ncbi:unnamed protein product [Blepharisma stoltei]|uniref:RING-type domain-containing protein n=1 Tax=Blepharisma stoltei TaxID=1481888 RepID=A0AAU9JMX6_9CILI|nr:unnamed protein product [Blepharisma stoltei]
MNGSSDTNSLKNKLLELGFKENVIAIALWQTDNISEAIQCILDVTEKGRSQIPAKDYYFLQLREMGYPLDAVSKAAEKPSLTEALDFLNNPPEINQAPKKRAHEAAEKPLPIIFFKKPQEKNQVLEQPAKNSASMSDAEKFLHIGLAIFNNFQEENKVPKKPAEPNSAFHKIINIVEDIGDRLFCKGGPVDTYAQKLKQQGKSLETAFNEIKRNIIRRGCQERPRNEDIQDFSPEEIKAAREESKEDILHPYLYSEQINEDFPIEEQFADWEEPINQNLLQERQNINEEIPFEEQDAYHEGDNYQYISPEPIIINGNVFPPRSQLYILNILESYYRPNGISESNMKKLREIRYQAGTSPDTCAICMEAFTANEFLQKLPCNHCFHNDCIKKWLKMSAKCPLDLLDI